MYVVLGGNGCPFYNLLPRTSPLALRSQERDPGNKAVDFPFSSSSSSLSLPMAANSNL